MSFDGGPREIFTWFRTVYGVGPTTAIALLIGWLLAAGSTHIGIPSVNPTISPTPRPLETLGTLAICLPACLHASLLRDHAAWLTTASPRSPWKLRLAWLALVVMTGSLFAICWAVTLPANVPRLHVFAFWILVLSLAVLSVTAIGNDLALVFPVALVFIFTLGSVVPFKINVVYNIQRTSDLVACALTALLVSAYAFSVHGDRRIRKDS